MDSHTTLVKEHFDIKYADYDQLIRRLIPRYEELHEEVVRQIDYPTNIPLTILDLGVGTGQTGLALLTKFPQATLHGVDISSHMLSQAESRLEKVRSRVTLEEQDIASLTVSDHYDVCVAVLSVHHLNEPQKQVLFKILSDCLMPGGILVIGDIVTFDNPGIAALRLEEWKQHLMKNLGEEQGKYWFENHLEEDLPSSVTRQISWLQQAGFTKVQASWEYMNYAVIVAKKE
ncbi:MAG: class I SAM-dependent methyltransferase [bacterium]